MHQKNHLDTVNHHLKRKYMMFKLLDFFILSLVIIATIIVFSGICNIIYRIEDLETKVITLEKDVDLLINQEAEFIELFA